MLCSFVEKLGTSSHWWHWQCLLSHQLLLLLRQLTTALHAALTFRRSDCTEIKLYVLLFFLILSLT